MNSKCVSFFDKNIIRIISYGRNGIWWWDQLLKNVQAHHIERKAFAATSMPKHCRKCNSDQICIIKKNRFKSLSILYIFLFGECNWVKWKSYWIMLTETVKFVIEYFFIVFSSLFIFKQLLRKKNVQSLSHKTKIKSTLQLHHKIEFHFRKNKNTIKTSLVFLWKLLYEVFNWNRFPLIKVKSFYCWQKVACLCFVPAFKHGIIVKKANIKFCVEKEKEKRNHFESHKKKKKRKWFSIEVARAHRHSMTLWTTNQLNKLILLFVVVFNVKRKGFIWFFFIKSLFFVVVARINSM